MSIARCGNRSKHDELTRNQLTLYFPSKGRFISCTIRMLPKQNRRTREQIDMLKLWARLCIYTDPRRGLTNTFRCC